MKISLRGGLGRGQPELEIAFYRSVSVGELLEAVAERVPALRPFLSARDEVGGRVALLIVANGQWVHPGDSLSDEDSVEIHPPIAGGGS